MYTYIRLPLPSTAQPNLRRNVNNFVFIVIWVKITSTFSHLSDHFWVSGVQNMEVESLQNKHGISVGVECGGVLIKSGHSSPFCSL